MKDLIKLILWFIPIFLAMVGILALCVYFFPDAEAAEEIDMSIIAKIESNNNPNAYNPISQARGLYQITPICLQDYVERKQLIYINPESLFDPILNKQIAEWYLTHRIPQMLKWYKIPVTIENILWAYNAGIGMVIKGIKPKETQNYIKKYYALTGNHN